MIHLSPRPCARLVALSFVALVGLTAAVPAQDERATTLQREAESQFQELHERMQRLQLVKAEQDPQASATLEAGNRFIQERGIGDRMAAIRDMLDGERYDEALDAMVAVRSDLRSLLDLLLDRALDVEELLAEIERLEAYKERVDALVDEQRSEKDAAARAAALQQHLDALDAAKRELEGLRDDQAALRDRANQAGLQAEAQAAERMAQDEDALRQRAENATPKLRALEQQARELEAGESPAGDDPQAAGQTGEGQCAGSCQGAAGAMGEARQQLQQNRPERSLQDMDRAREQLERAIEELEQMSEEARRELLELPFDAQQRAQESTRVSTDTLAQDMEADDREASESDQPRNTPGKRPVQQAVPKQKAAAGQLEERKPGDASQEQQDALEDLQQAQQQLEDALSQLRQQLQDEVLRALEERFAAMLEVQQELSERTRAADDLARETMTAAGSVPRAVADRAVEIGTGERELAGEANDALKLLQEDGSTAAFPDVVEFLRDDLQAVAERLEAAHVGRTTQELQGEIEQTLKDLIDALRRQIEQQEGDGQCAMCNGQPVLVPRSAELKLVMIKQRRVNKRTERFDEQVPEQLRVTEEAQESARELSRQQATVEQLLRRMAVQLQKDEQARN